jgi:hypothetical protein
MKVRSVQGRCRWLLVLVLVLVSACSSTTFVYNRLDFLLPWYLGDYVELEREQKKYLDAVLDPFLQWHRMEELLMELGEQLSDQQIEGFVAELRDKQTEYEEKYLPRTDEEYHEEAYDNLRDSLQDYMGRLDSDQREMLQVSSHELLRSDGVWLSERAAWIDMLERILQREPGWQQALRDAIASRDERMSAAYRDTYAHNTAVIYAALAQVINSRSDKQDRRLRGKIDGFEQDLETLIEQGRATQERAAQERAAQERAAQERAAQTI